MSARTVSAGKRPVVFLATRYTTGGATLNAQMLAEQFLERDIPAELWCLYRSSELQARGLPVRVMLDHAPRSPLALARMARRFRAALSKVDPVAVVGFHPLANVLGALAATPRRRFIATQRNAAESQSPILRKVEAMLGATSRYHANIAVSQAVRESYAHYSPAYLSNLRVIPNGLPPLAIVEEDKAAARHALGLPVNARLVGNIGRLHPQKSPEFMLDLAARVPEITFVMAGDGPSATTIAETVRARGLDVILPGRLEGADVTRLLRALDLFLFPSRYEGFGRALLEALSEGLPVIAHDLPVTREVLASHADFLPLNADRWAALIRQRLAEECAATQVHARIARAHSFSLDTMVDRYADAILAGSSPALPAQCARASDDVQRVAIA
jgi:glycosyltransferase involved in cell wall biosynthesis